MDPIVSVEVIERKIYLLRGHKVMLDSDLANLYGVATKVLLQAVKRNLKRFPSDFMFPLNYQEVAALRSQIVTLKTGRGGRAHSLRLWNHCFGRGRPCACPCKKLLNGQPQGSPLQKHAWKI